MMGLIGAARSTISARRPALQALISALVFYLTLATSGLLLVVALFTRRHRTLHDLVSGLVVVRVRAMRPLTATWAEAGTCRAEPSPHEHVQTAAPAAVLLHDGPPALPLSGGTHRAQGGDRDRRPGRRGAARPAVARRLPPQPQHRLRAGLPVLPGLRADPHSRRHLPARPHAAQNRPGQRRAGGVSRAGPRHRRAVPAVPALPAGAPRRRRHGNHEFLRLPRHGRGHADRDLHHRIPRSTRTGC